VTSGYSSFSSCRQYLQNITDAQESVGPAALRIEKVRAFYNHPLFIEANASQIRLALTRFEDPAPAHLVFTAHSIPESMAANCDYVAQLNETGSLIAQDLKIENWQLVYQSRSGSPSQPWLGPDVCDHLRSLHSAGVTKAILAPIGFVSDHMEVVYDLDVEAQKVASEVGMAVVRASTAGTHPSFIKMIRELILERIENVPARFIGSRRAGHSFCQPDCCAAR